MNDEHKVILTSTKDLSISGVESVASCTPTSIVLSSVCGGMVVKGKQLHVEKLDVESKILEASGIVEEIKYVPAKKSFAKRLLK